MLNSFQSLYFSQFQKKKVVWYEVTEKQDRTIGNSARVLRLILVAIFTALPQMTRGLVAFDLLFAFAKKTTFWFVDINLYQQGFCQRSVPPTKV